jgi:dienelactone hydrolase
MSVIRSSRLFQIAALFFVLCVGNAVPSHAQQPSVAPAAAIEISLSPLPFDLRGLLRRPEGSGRFPAVVLLPACGEYAGLLDEDWGARLSSWGYVTLTIDGFGPRGIKDCDHGLSENPDLVLDAYRGLNFLIAKSFVDPKRVAIAGFAWGAMQTLSAFKGNMTVPTLILIGERDDLATADACRKMAAGEDDFGISRQKGAGAPVRLIVYPDAYLAFDLPVLKSATWYRGHRLEFNKPAADQASEALRAFLQANIGGRQ